MTDILTQIVSRRQSDIEKSGYTMGEEIPKERTRAAPIPFPSGAEKGVVLEIKRASPSKGDIAPGLDAGQTALQYAQAGTSAISVLTERHWFKGSLADLQAAALAADKYAQENNKPRVAILRKDFLLSPEDVEIAYRAGADAVLLIARILSAPLLIEMAEKCASLGMTAFIELREESDLEKLAKVAEAVDPACIVCGVNARDLQNFSIDLLTPACLLAEIQGIITSHAKKAITSGEVKVIFESGIRTPQAAHFAGSLGFSAMLLGEAAAKNPAEAKELVQAFMQAPSTPQALFWKTIARRLRKQNTPFIKICGITNLKDAQKAYELGADFLGFIFWEKSPRRTDEKTVSLISATLREEAKKLGKRAPLLVGVTVDPESCDGKTVQKLLDEGILDCMQLHGCADSFLTAGGMQTDLPHYGAVNISSEEDLSKIDFLRQQGEPRILIDAHSAISPGGTGKRIADTLVEKVSCKTKLWLAGGITPENIASVCKKFHPELIDIASGVESAPGIKDHARLEALFSQIEKN